MTYVEMHEYNQEYKYDHGNPSRTIEQVRKELKDERENFVNAAENFAFHGFAKYRVRAMIAEAHVKNLEDELFYLLSKQYEER